MEYSSFIRILRSRLTFGNLAGHPVPQLLGQTGDLDEFIDRVAETYLQVSNEERAALCRTFTDWEGQWYLGEYAGRMCQRIRDRKDPGLVRLALAALLISDQGQDPRDTLYALGHLYRAAQQIGIRDPMPMFRGVAALSDHQGPRSGALLMDSFEQTAVCRELAAIPLADLATLLRKGDTIGVRTRIVAGDDPNARGAKGVTPLMQAASKGSRPLIQMLVSAGADVNALDDAGRSALVYAAEQGRWSAVELLLEAGAKTDVQVEGVPLEDFIGQRASTPLTKRALEVLNTLRSRRL